MVELNFRRARPEAILDLTRVEELTDHGRDDGMLRIGAGVTYTRAIAELGEQLPGLAIASHTVDSPQIRNRGTIGGNLGSSSPAGDALPRSMRAKPRSSWPPPKARDESRSRTSSPARSATRSSRTSSSPPSASPPPRARSSSARSARATRW
jgi:hypothetical protein